jgi:ABC-2 type transport system permease protein
MSSTYLALFKISLKDKIAYFKDYMFSAVGRTLTYVLMIFVWNIIYFGGHFTTIKNFNLLQIDAYFVIGSALFLLINSNNDYIVSNDMKMGNVAKSLIKPLSYVYSVFIESFSENILLLPSVLIVIFFTLYYTGLVTTLFSIITVIIIIIIAYLIINILQFMIGSFAIYTSSAFGISILFFNIIEILGGAIMPLTFFPSYVNNIVMLMPFQLFTYVPASILIGSIPSSTYIYYIFFGLFWLFIIAFVGYIFWNHVKKKISSVGG